MKTLAQVTALIALAMAAPVIAEPMSVAVSFADLNLASAAGKASLERRINGAIRTVCGTPDGLDLSAMAASRNCIAKARTNAQPQITAAVENARNTVRIASVR